MSYKNDKEQMNNEMNLHKQRVLFVIKITFIVFAVALVALATIFVVSLFKGGLFAAEKDETAPIISAREGTTVIGYLGESPTYKKYVTVSDDKDDEPILAIDHKDVDINTEGSYKVRYQAKDKSNNKSKVFTLTYVVKNKAYSKDKLMAMVAELAKEKGITKSMSTVEQIKAIYKIINIDYKITFSEASDLGESNIPNIDRNNWKTDWIEEGIRTLELYNAGEGVGDCYSFYAVSKAFFEYFGIKNIGIRRDTKIDDELDANGNRKGTHFWHIVDIGGGKWYYYDATRLGSTFKIDGTKNACLITQEKLDSYVISKTGGTYFYTIAKNDKCLDFSSAGVSTYPKIATEAIK